MNEPVAEDRKTKELRLAKWAGMAVVAFCVVRFAESIAFPLLVDSFTLDIGVIIYFLVGWPTMKGSRRAAKWALGITVFYILAGAALAVVLRIDPGRLTISGKPIPTELLSHVTTSLALGCLWSVLNAVLLIQFLSFSRRGRIIQSGPAETH